MNIYIYIYIFFFIIMHSFPSGEPPPQGPLPAAAQHLEYPKLTTIKGMSGKALTINGLFCFALRRARYYLLVPLTNRTPPLRFLFSEVQKLLNDKSRKYHLNTTQVLCCSYSFQRLLNDKSCVSCFY